MPLMPIVMVRKIEQIDRLTFGIEWTDGRKSWWRLAHLRRHCPCAVCRDEWTGKPLLDPSKIDENLTARKIESVGRYALTISFSDGHDTGIYSFPMLRDLDQNPENKVPA